jgi:membrane fusion protein, multidrug efflux system
VCLRTSPIKSMNKKILGVGLLLILALAGGGAYWMYQKNKSGSDKKPEEVPLSFVAKELTQPSLLKLGGNLQWSGNLAAAQSAVVRSKTNGTLMSLSVKEGAVVQAGQTLGTIDTSDFAIRLNERQAAIESAQANLSNAQRVYDTNQGLSEKGFISPAAMDGYKTQLDAAKAQMKVAQAQNAGVKLALRETALIAPMSGTVSKRNALPGEKLSIEQAIITLVTTNPIEMHGTIAPHQVSALKIGMAVSAEIDGLSGTRNGKLERIGPAADIGTKAIPVVVRFDNSDGALQPGQFAQATTTIADEVESLTVPVQAIALENNQQIVWVVENEKLKRQYVKLGKRDENGVNVQVLEGLKASDQILAMRFDGLKQGRAIKVQTAGEVKPTPKVGTTSEPKSQGSK